LVVEYGMALPVTISGDLTLPHRNLSLDVDSVCQGQHYSRWAQ
jgi:hypothetical protein